ncbi:MAG: MBL fold metallo-hydrolase [Candidatus Micrarchaeota archaeon]
MKWIAFGLVLLLVLGCIGGGQPPAGEQETGNRTPETGNASGGYLVIREGEGTVVTQGNATPPQASATEYVSTPNTDLYVYFFNVGSGDTQGDAVLIKKGDTDILVDGGPSVSQQKLVNMLLEKGVDDFELVVSTHDDPEHYGGLEYVSNRFRFGEVWRPEEGGQEYAAYLANLGEESLKIVGEGDRAVLNGINITVLNPIKGEDRFFDVNNDGIVLKVEDRGLCVLLTGDILGSQQRVAQLSGPCQIVQWPNHGMGAGLTEINWMMDQTKPELIVISGSATDWTNSRQSLKNAAVLGTVRNITVIENYLGEDVKIVWNGMRYNATVER